MCTTCYANITDFSRAFSLAVQSIAGSTGRDDRRPWLQDAFGSTWARFSRLWEEGKPEKLPCAPWRAGQREILAVASSDLVRYIRKAARHAKASASLAQTGRTRHDQAVRVVFGADKAQEGETVEFVDMASLKNSVRLDKRSQLSAGDDLDVLWTSIHSLGSNLQGCVRAAISARLDRAEDLTVSDLLSSEALDRALLMRWIETADIGAEAPRWKAVKGVAILRGMAQAIKGQGGAWGHRARTDAGINPYVSPAKAAAFDKGREAAMAAMADERAFWTANNGR